MPLIKPIILWIVNFVDQTLELLGSQWFFGFVVGALLFAFWDPMTRIISRARSNRLANPKHSSPSNVVQSVAPDSATFQLFPFQDGVDVSIIIKIHNPTLAPTEIKIHNWDCEIGGIRPADRKGVSNSTPLRSGGTQSIRLARVRLPRVGSGVSGWAEMTILFGDKRGNPSTAVNFRYEFEFDDYGKMVPGETQISDYLNHHLVRCDYYPASEFRKVEA